MVTPARSKIYKKKSLNFFPPSHFDSKTSINVFRAYGNTGEKCLHLVVHVYSYRSSLYNCRVLQLWCACAKCDKIHTFKLAFNKHQITSHCLMEWWNDDDDNEMENLKALVTTVFKKTDVTKITSTPVPIGCTTAFVVMTYYS